MTATYRITVETGDVGSAGTDANVYLTLYGANDRNSGERQLENSEDNFERGKIDLFSIETEDLGELEKIRIRQDNSGNWAGWFLRQIIVNNEDGTQEWVFPCERWLSIEDDDHRIDRILYAKKV